MTNSYLNLLKEADYNDLVIKQVFDYYRQCYLNNERYEHIVYSERIPKKLRSHEFIGVSNRTLGLHMPERSTFKGGKIRGTLLQVGLLKATGHELFRGCLVFPTLNDDGQVTSAVGYRYGTRIRHWQIPVIYWQRPDNLLYVSQAMQSIREVLNGKA